MLLFYKGEGTQNNLNVLHGIAVECSPFKMCIRHLLMGGVINQMEKTARSSVRASPHCKL